MAIALGIGVNTGIFTLLNAFALRPLPVADASEVVTIYQIFRGLKHRAVNGATPMFSYPEFEHYRAENRVFSGMAAYHPVSVTMAGELPQVLNGFATSCGYFTVLGKQPPLGRGFRAVECGAEGSGPVVVLSNRAWRRLFSADPRVIGKNVVLNREHLTIVGIAPRGFAGTEPFSVDFWVPVSMADKLDHAGDFENANLSWLMMLGRRKPGVSVEQVRTDLAVIASRIDRLYPGRTTTLDIHPATFFSNPYERKFVLSVAAVILTAVGLVLLIVCANVANLLLARASGRRKEIAVRLSLGASRGRLIRQLLTESVMLSLVGGIAGSLLAFWGCSNAYRILSGTMPVNTPRLALNVAPDLSVLGYALLLTLGAGLVFGLVPALEASKPDLNSALKDEGAGSGIGRSRNWLRSVLVAAQVSICLVLMIAAGLLARGLQAAQTLDPGFQTRGVI
ncbi:MAG: ABC transporter permease, partial [Bryobacteraceae bacterium]